MALMAELGIVTTEDRYRLLLEISRIVNAPLGLQDVTDAVGKALQPLAAVDAIVLLTVENGRIIHRSIHVPDAERREGDTFRDIAARTLGLTSEEAEAKLPIERLLAGSNLEHAFSTGRPYVMNKFDASKIRFDGEAKLVGFGIKAYVLCPLTVRDSLVGALAFSRRIRDEFNDDEVQLFEEVSGIVATALANALAYEQISALKDQLQAENILLREEIASVGESGEIAGRSPAIRLVLAAIDKVAATDSTVLIYGETGTGKELVAREIHRRSVRGQKPLIKANCAAVPASLIASELFGHERGAFTGAAQRRLGRFEMAAGGSLFLDEVGEIPLDVQVALLRVMQEREFERLGGTQTIRADVRLIAATNRDLQKAISDGSFRSDLFYRLNVFPIEVPPLRERREDIPLLADLFLARYSARLGRKMRGVETRTMELLRNYDWPGNIRELQNVIERAVILSEDGVLRVEPRALVQPAAETTVRPSVLRTQERETIEVALVESGGRIAGPKGAAARLGLPASTLESKIRALGIDKFRYRRLTATV